MSLADRLATDLTKLMNSNEFGTSSTVKYMTGDGQSTTLTNCILFEESTERQERDGLTVKIRFKQVCWPAAEISDVNEIGSVDIDGEKWSIATTPLNDGVQVVVQLEIHEIMEHARPGYRRR